MIAGPHHIALFVRDLPRMELFYGELLRLPVLRRWPGHAGEGDRSVWLDLGQGAFIALERFAAVAHDPPPDRMGYHLLAVRIPASERAAWVARLTSAGHPVYRETPHTVYVRDPEGNPLGLSHWPDPAVADAPHHI